MDFFRLSMSNKEDEDKKSDTPSNVPKGFEKFFKKKNTEES